MSFPFCPTEGSYAEIIKDPYPAPIDGAIVNGNPSMALTGQEGIFPENIIEVFSGGRTVSYGKRNDSLALAPKPFFTSTRGDLKERSIDVVSQGTPPQGEKTYQESRRPSFDMVRATPSSPASLNRGFLSIETSEESREDLEAILRNCSREDISTENWRLATQIAQEFLEAPFAQLKEVKEVVAKRLRNHPFNLKESSLSPLSIFAKQNNIPLAVIVLKNDIYTPQKSKEYQLELIYHIASLLPSSPEQKR